GSTRPRTRGIGELPRARRDSRRQRDGRRSDWRRRMTIHVFASFVTPNGTAANNRGVTEGNMTTLQKLVWKGQVHTTVSAEAIRFALRRRLSDYEECNRTFDDTTRQNDWKDPTFARWAP